MTTGLPSGSFFAPAGKINFCVAALDEPTGKLYLDLMSGAGTAGKSVGPSFEYQPVNP
jgi:hypothetical protein